MISFSRINNSNYYILQFNDGAIVGVDKSTGGYPFAAFSPSLIHYWAQYDKAVSYAQMFKDKINQEPIQVFGLFNLGDTE